MTDRPWARFDDLRANRAVRFAPTDSVLATDDPARVEEVFAAVERATAAGRWAFGFLIETMRLGADGRLHQLDEHLWRVQRSADYFGFAHDATELRRVLAGATAGRGSARVRLTLRRDGASSVDLAALPEPAAGPVRLVLDAEPVDAGDVFLRHKTTERGAYERRRRRHPGADDVVLVNTRGEVTEAATANLAVLLDGRWCTPPLASGCLPGVERAVRLTRGELTEAVVTPADLDRVEQIAVMSSLRGWRVARSTATDPTVI